MIQWCLERLSQQQLTSLVQQTQAVQVSGELPTYLAPLASVNQRRFGVWVERIRGGSLGAGDWADHFALMSVVKPFLLLYLLETRGAAVVFDQVGREPSAYPFNSLEQLLVDQGWPRNPMINSGALVMAALLGGETSQFQTWLNQRANIHLALDQDLLKAVQQGDNHHNQALAQYLAKVKGFDPEQMLQVYFWVCCLSGNAADLARLGMLLVQPPPATVANAQIVVDLMISCGLYQASATWGGRLGLPLKSGVSGALLALVPGQGVVGIYSPPLDPAGNSILALRLLERLASL